MFFLELWTTDARKARIHFAIGPDIADLLDDCELAKQVHANLVKTVGDKVDQWLLGPFTHYNDAKDAAEEQSRTVEDCSVCFTKVLKKPGELIVNVVVFVWGCVEPDILVTFDDDLAKQTYLKHQKQLREEDFLVWQEVPVRAGYEPVGFPEPVNMAKYIKLNELFEWKSDTGSWSTYKVMGVAGDPPHTVTVQRQSGVTGEPLVELTAGEYLTVRLQEMYKEQDKNAVLRAAKPD